MTSRRIDTVVLASGSPYRAKVLRSAGYELIIDVPAIDERAADNLMDSLGPDGLALELARRKAESVAPRHPGRVVLAGDQVGIVGSASLRMLTKQPDQPGAVEQLMALSGTTHHLYNGMYVLDVASGGSVGEVDLQEVTMRDFSRQEAVEYVRRFTPFDTAGSYRMEDGPEMAPIPEFVSEVVGEDGSGVLGVPLPMVRRMMERLMDATG